MSTCGFRRQDGSPYLHVSLPGNDGFLRLSSGTTPAEFLEASALCQAMIGVKTDSLQE